MNATLLHPTELETTVGRTDEMLLNLGPQHPATHGVFRVVLGLDGERVTRCVPQIGYLHRNHEKLDEVRTYQQCIPYADRMEYVSSLHNELPLCFALEEMLGIEVPIRGWYFRTITFELNRIASHLVWLGTFMLDLGAIRPFLWSFRDRELVVDIDERNAFDDALEFCQHFESKLPEYAMLTLDASLFPSRTVGLGAFDPRMTIKYGVSSPVLRGSSVTTDLRRDEPQDAYDPLEFEPRVEYR
jgi:NADH-quinone oxidoreductase subunit D